ncbi:MAG: hypothetical protein FJX54_06735 [Alphaproteobacteria bacterium]|nr:hypothetical protein [Alphaproteobacteria bacterium]
MILGSAAFGLFHVALSFVGIFSGFAVLASLLRGDRPEGLWNHVFLITTLLTSLTGFLFPFKEFTPAIGTGIVATLVLIPTLLAFYRFDLEGKWRKRYVFGAVVSLYLNTFVLVVQSFLKFPQLKELAPNGNEPPFAAVQGLVLIFFAYTGWQAAKRIR